MKRERSSDWQDFPERMLSAGVDVWSLIVLVVLLALATNYFASILFSLFWDQSANFTIAGIQWLQIFVTGMIILFCLLIGIEMSSRDRVFTSLTIDFLIPIQHKADKIEIELIEHFHPSKNMRTLFASALHPIKHEDEWKAFASSFGKQDGWRRDLHGLALTRIYELIIHVLISTLNRYGENSLGKSHQFFTGSDLYAAPSQVKKMKVTDFRNGDLLENSVILTNDPNFFKQSFLMPQNVTPIVNQLERAGFIAEDDAAATYSLVLQSKYGTVGITPSQIWTQIHTFSQAGRILEKNLPEKKEWQAKGIVVAIKFSASFRRVPFLFMLKREKYEQTCRWMVSGLFEYFDRKLNWNRFIETDLDRKVVDMYEDVQVIKKQIKQ